MQPDFKRLTKKKTVLVTGASRGIGRAVAELFADYGYLVVLNASGERELKETASAIETKGIPCVMAQGDIANPAVVQNLFRSIEKISREQGYENTLDILINNAGIAHIGLLQDMTREEWDRIVNVNLGAVFNTCKEAIPYMMKHHSGRILNISSVWGVTGASCEVAYSATKGGVNAFTRALAKELAPSGIVVNAIACGAIDTSMNDHLDAVEKAELCQEIPAGRMGTPKEVAEVCLKLCTMTPYLTGQVIGLDGGWI